MNIRYRVELNEVSTAVRIRVYPAIFGFDGAPGAADATAAVH